MRIIFIVLSISGAAFVEWTLGWSVGGIVIPLIVSTVLLWFWRLPLGSRFVLGTSVGFILESFRLFPFGTYLFTFWGLAVLVSILHFYFSSLKSPFTQGVGLAITLGVFFFLIILGSNVLGRIVAESVIWTGILWSLAGGAIFWVLFLSLVWFAVNRFLARTY